jgi:hypothetical protein
MKPSIMIQPIIHSFQNMEELRKMEIQDVGSSLVIPLGLAGCMIQFKHRLPTTEEINLLKQYCLTQSDNPWNFS